MPKHAKTGESTLFLARNTSVNGRMHYNSSNGFRNATNDPQGGNISALGCALAGCCCLVAVWSVTILTDPGPAHPCDQRLGSMF